MRYVDLKKLMRKANAEKKERIGFVTFTEDSFDFKLYSVESRTYLFSSNNNAFNAKACGYSIFGDSFDKKDCGVRLDAYMKDEGQKNGWKIESCGIVKYHLIGSRACSSDDFLVHHIYDSYSQAREALFTEISKITGISKIALKSDGFEFAKHGILLEEKRAVINRSLKKDLQEPYVFLIAEHLMNSGR